MNWVAHLISAFIALFATLLPIFGHSSTYIAKSIIYSSSPKVSIIFGGDMMFDRSIRTTINEKGGDFIFSCIDPVLRGADMVVANLEGPITGYPSKSEGSRVAGAGNYTFTFATSTGELLYRHGIRMLNIGNNHISNFKRPGVLSTEKALSDAHVQYFGDPISQRVATTTIHGVPLAFINFNQFEKSSNASTTIAQIKRARERGEIVVVYAHWGEEYVPATKREKTLAHEFVDGGAAIVIGSHPHVVQEHEMYRGKYIYYSLGNFIFDQYWNDMVRTGLLLNVSFDTNGVRSVQEIPVRLERDRTTCPVA